MSARFGLRAAQTTLRQQINPNLRFAQRRLQSTAAPATETAAKNESAFARLWNSPVGPKTVHFWAPIMKWGIVIAGAADFARPPEQLSMSQNAALMATGLIWTRWCFVIKPRNLFLASVNFMLFCVGATQVSRCLIYQRSVKNDSLTDEAKAAAKEAGKNLENAVDKAESKITTR